MTGSIASVRSGGSAWATDIAFGAGFGGQRADSGNAENDWLGLIRGSSDLSLAVCGYAVVAVLRSLRLCPMT